MQISMYQASAPVFVKFLTNLSTILKKAAEHCAAKKIDPSVMVNARLAPDMFPLSRQIQIATDQAKGCVARLSGSTVPSYADTEATFEELQARLQKTIDFVQSFKPEQIDGSDDREITLKLGPQEYTFKGKDYLLNLVYPNFYFHITTTYAILRHNGVEIGKRDFLGA